MSRRPSQALAETDAEQPREQLSAAPGKPDLRFRGFARFSALNCEHLMASLGTPTPRSPSSRCIQPWMQVRTSRDCGQKRSASAGSMLSCCIFSGAAGFLRGGEILLPPLQRSLSPFTYMWHLHAEDAKRAETHKNTREDSDILCTFPLIMCMVQALSSVGHGASLMQQ